MGQVSSLDTEFMGMRDEQRARARDILQRAETEVPAEPSFAERFVSGVKQRGGDFLTHLTRPGFLSQTLGPHLTVPDPQKQELQGFLRLGDLGLNLLNLLGEQAGEGTAKLMALFDSSIRPEDQEAWEYLKKLIPTVVEFGVGGVAGVGARAKAPLTALEHYGKPHLTTVDPAKFGTGLAGRERARAVEPGFAPRSYFYEAGTVPEARFATLSKYRAEIPTEQIYDIGVDPLGIVKGKVGTAAEQAVRDAGFTAYKNSTSALPHTVASFNPLPVRPAFLDDIVAAHAASGGSTFSIRTGKNIAGDESLWAVGVHPERTVTLTHSPTPDDLAVFLSDNMELFHANPALNIGTWAETNAQGQLTGRHILDLSLAASKQEALELAHKHGQAAITNLGTFETLHLSAP